MVRKIIVVFSCVMLLTAICGVASAAEFSIYDGNMSSTYITYFRDIVSGIGFNDHYVLFRASQYDYIMIVGELTYDRGIFALSDVGTIYTISTDNSYNGSYSYNVSSIESFSLVHSDQIVYSDIGQFPQLIERGEKYEILTTVLIAVALLGYVVSCIFKSGAR